MWGYSAEAWREWCLTNDFDPDNIEDTMHKIQEGPKLVCLKCDQPLDVDEIHIYIDPPPPIVAGKYFHGLCFVKHVEENIDNPNDPVLVFMRRKKV